MFELFNRKPNKPISDDMALYNALVAAFIIARNQQDKPMQDALAKLVSAEALRKLK